MNIDDIEPGTIKDRILQSVRALGELATRSRLNKSVECSNDQILAIAIESLHRDGYIHITDAGHYALADEVAAAMPPLRPAAAVATPVSTSPQHSEPDMTTTQVCEISRGYGCGKRKPLDDFYKGSKKCKRCTLDRQKDLKLQRQKENGEDTTSSPKRSTSTTPAAPKRQAKPSLPSVDALELVIPADGQITCRAVTTGSLDSYLIQQDTNLIACSYRQLQALRDWASGQLKKSAS